VSYECSAEEKPWQYKIVVGLKEHEPMETLHKPGVSINFIGNLTKLE